MERNWRLAGRRKTLRQRALILREIKRFFVESAYLEIETPYRVPAPAPESHIDAIGSGDWYLQTSPELCMKRLMAAGYEKIFQICRCWREGERGSRHLPEFTMLEWYRAGCDYQGLMKECEEMIRRVAASVGAGERLVYLDREIDLKGPWERISVKKAFERYSTVTTGEALLRDTFDEVMVRDIEPRLGAGRPTFIYDYPAERRALARLKEEDPTEAERFELYIGGLELANGFSELVDPQEQRSHFQEENDYRVSMGRAAYAISERFLEELGNMPPSAGIALGVDRLVMVFTDARRIDDVVAFTPEEL
ncbi:MAG: EF-P lysine aminoacylase GenX [Deltaproteobacteria bacterium RBG_13_52_11b]|nr:MAG: EF-P lysine aminoacylase GenX [Deltaproteobacteria bacterium RBG_13_52_11b]